MSPVINGTPWILVCTDKFEETVTHFRDDLGLVVTSEGVPTIDKQFQRYAQFGVPGGTVIEVVEPIESLRAVYKGTVYSLTVSDVLLSRKNMESKGTKFISPIFDDGQGNGWTYYQLPSGQIFQIQGRIKC
jgi:hypothetical protein